MEKVDRRTVGIPAKAPEEAPIDLVSAMNRAFALGAITAESLQIINTERIEWRNKD